MTLVEFINARLDEDEATARDAARYDFAETGWGVLTASAAIALHVRQHSPARVLAEVDAKRRIVDHAEHWEETLYATPEGWTAVAATAYRMAMQWALELLALPYADHPDYDPSWRP